MGGTYSSCSIAKDGGGRNGVIATFGEIHVTVFRGRAMNSPCREEAVAVKVPVGEVRTRSLYTDGQEPADGGESFASAVSYQIFQELRSRPAYCLC